MNRLISTLRLLALTLAALLCLCGCGGTGAAQPVNDERAAALAKELKANPCPFRTTPCPPAPLRRRRRCCWRR